MQRAIDFVIRESTQHMIGCTQTSHFPDKDTL